jgi:quinol monooxygenase YgiN
VAVLSDPQLGTTIKGGEMAYFYEISFTIDHSQLDELAIGGSLERVLGYLRTILPEKPGFISSKALRSVADSNPVRVVVWSEWQDWEDLLEHVGSSIIEDKVLLEFDPHIKLEHLTANSYYEIE